MIDYASAKKIRFGADGSGGGGEDGATFFPTVSEEGVISWTNNGGYPNPDPVNIKGQDGTVEFDELTPAQKAELKGDKGDSGVTPNLVMEVNVDSTTGTPDVDVTKTGTLEQPVFNLQFSGLKGETGQSGFSPTIEVDETATGHDITVTDASGSSTFSVPNGIDGQAGTTPNITANAIISGTTGTPSIDVTKTGTLENPVFTFDFENIKGEKGDTGDRGLPGVQGVPGIAGQDGTTYTPEIGTITTVDAFEDADASVTIQGTRAIFDFSIPRGEKGDSGATGVNIIQYTMLLTGWVDNIYSFESQFPFASYNLEIEPNGDLITEQQLRAWNEGQMTGSYSANRCIAMGSVPTTNIPIILKVTSKGE